MKTLDTASDTDLLRELLNRNRLEQGPIRSVHSSTIRESVIAVGNDHTASILIHSDAAEVLFDSETLEGSNVGVQSND